MELSGEIDYHQGVPRLDLTLSGLKDIPRVKVILDFKNVSYCASGGIAAILEASEVIRNNGGQLVCAAVSGAAREPMELLDIPDVVPFHESVEKALQALEKRPE